MFNTRQHARPILRQKAFRIPTARVSSFATAPQLVHVNAAPIPIFAEDPMYPLMEAELIPATTETVKPQKSVRFEPCSHPLLFSVDEVEEINILKEQRLADLKKNSLKSFHLGLSSKALETPSFNPIKNVWAEKHAREEHGTSRDETDDIMDIICGSDNVDYIVDQLQQLVKYGRFVWLEPQVSMPENLRHVLSRTYRFPIEQLLKVAKFAHAMMRRDGMYEIVFSICIREVLKRCSFSYKKFVRQAGGEEAAAKDLASMAGILALVCKNFCIDMDKLHSYKRDKLRKGPWKDTLKTWLHRTFNETLYSRNRDAQASIDQQIHFTQAPQIILKIAEFLGSNGIKAVPHLSKSTVASMAANLHAAFDEIITMQCDWMVADMAVSCHELAGAVAKVGLGYEAPEGAILAALKTISDST